MHGSITLPLNCVPRIIFCCSLKLVGKVHLCAKTQCSKKAAVRSPCIPTPVFSPSSQLFCALLTARCWCWRIFKESLSGTRQLNWHLCAFIISSTWLSARRSASAAGHGWDFVHLRRVPRGSVGPTQCSGKGKPRIRWDILWEEKSRDWCNHNTAPRTWAPGDTNYTLHTGAGAMKSSLVTADYTNNHQFNCFIDSCFQFPTCSLSAFLL